MKEFGVQIKGKRLWRVRVGRGVFTWLIVVMCVFILGAGITGRNAIAAQLTDWKVLSQPERLTELYFTNTTDIPNAYIPGNEQTVAFTVHNLEQRTTTYTYQIMQQDEYGNRQHQLKKSSFIIKQDAQARISEKVVLADMGKRSSVSIILSNQNQFIQYWVESK